jgi:hypothetical protein
MEPIEDGGWRYPRWLGCDIRLTALLVFCGFLILLAHELWLTIIGFCVLIFAWLGFARMFELEPRQVEITFSTWPLFSLRQLARLEDDSTRPVHHPRTLR